MLPVVSPVIRPVVLPIVSLVVLSLVRTVLSPLLSVASIFTSSVTSSMTSSMTSSVTSSVIQDVILVDYKIRRGLFCLGCRLCRCTRPSTGLQPVRVQGLEYDLTVLHGWAHSTVVWRYYRCFRPSVLWYYEVIYKGKDPSTGNLYRPVQNGWAWLPQEGLGLGGIGNRFDRRSWYWSHFWWRWGG